MLRSYWARFHAWADGRGYTVNVPDLPGLTTEGDSWDEAMYMAREAVQGWLELALAQGEDLPLPSGREDIMAQPVAPDMGPAEYTLVTVALPEDSQSLLPDGLWADLARLSLEEGVPVNELLARAAREYLGRHQSHVK